MEMTGHMPRYMGGKHTSVHRKLNKITKSLIFYHLKYRQSHYSLKYSKQKYLPEDLNVKKMFIEFKELQFIVVISYETYRCIYNIHIRSRI